MRVIVSPCCAAVGGVGFVRVDRDLVRAMSNELSLNLEVTQGLAAGVNVASASGLSSMHHPESRGSSHKLCRRRS